ncbi:YwqG family protein [Luteolibacter pohnpeiensis]|nr:YwqG family protein [Luteolibacter pohnpeiensis]
MSSEMYQRVASRVGRPALQLLGTARETLTFFGGSPASATGFSWPRKDGKPLSFIGQLDLSELNLSDAAPWLPATGRLLFFYDMDEWPWGFDPKDRGGWAVIHDSGTDSVQSIPFPDDLKGENRPPRIKYLEGRPYTSIPSLERISLEEAGISEEEEEDYYELSVDAFDGNALHQIGGFPEPVQGDMMEEECHLVSGGVYCGDSTGYKSERADELRKEPNDWKLLLQFDTEDDLDLMWGDSGTLYYWIRERDARAGDFSNVWLVLQCC